MNLKKLTQTVLLIIPLIVLNGCEEWKTDEKLVQNIWREVVKITELNPDTPMPQIVFLQTSPSNIHGRFYFQDKRAEIYLESILKTIWQQRNYYYTSGLEYGCNAGPEEWKALVYNTVAHEMLHYALYLKGVPLYYQHNQMKEKEYLLSVVGYINDHFKINDSLTSHRNGCQADITMKSLMVGIKQDAEKIADMTKK